jgi:tetratricopeptide (TPR) repeat protein
MPEPRIIKVFIASPGDLAVERRAFKDVIDELNAGFGRGANVRFEPLGWEDALSTVGRRSQAVINQDIDACDIFVLVMWRRWGQDAPDAAPHFTSYTEEEFYRAVARYEKDAKPTIVVFFKHIDRGQMADAGPQLEKVLAFRKKLEATRKVLHRGFADEKAFRGEIDKHLVAFAKGEYAISIADRNVPIVPDSIQFVLERQSAELRRAIEELEKLKVEAKLAFNEAEQARAQAKDTVARAEAAGRVGEARAVEEAVALAEEAAKAALDGRIDVARQGFAKALDGTTNLRVLSLGFGFFKRIGDLDEAERLARRALAISGSESQTTESAIAYSNLGLVLDTRGEWDEAEAMLRKALAINEKLGRPEGVASDYCNLGLVLLDRGKLDEAEAMHHKALMIDAELGRLEGLASGCGNLGHVQYSRGNLDKAELMFRSALAIEEKLGGVEGMSNAFACLGLVLRGRGDLDGAEAMHRKSLAMNEKLGRLEGMANGYGNLGLVLKARGDFEGARMMWIQSRDLYTKCGARHVAARAQTLIDELTE